MTQPVTQAQDHDRRIGRLEGIAEQLDRRLDSIDRRLDGIEQRQAAQFRWLVGILFGVVGLQVTILLKLAG